MSLTNPTIINVVVPLPLDAVYSYLLPVELGPVEIGMRVLVPFGRRTITAYVVGFADQPLDNLKEVIELLDRLPLFTLQELEFFKWAANYYIHPLGEVIKAALPSGINLVGKKHRVLLEDGTFVAEEVLTGGRKVRRETFYRLLPVKHEGKPLRGRKLQAIELLGSVGEAPQAFICRESGIDAASLKYLVKTGFLEAEEREVYRDPFKNEVYIRDTPPELTKEQAAALDKIESAQSSRKFAPFLLHGVTGSGKTEVYLNAIASCLKKGRTALVLVPEIALTPQLVRRFRQRFNRGIAVLHSGLTPGERFDEWRRIRRNEAEIVIGARSAIFAPLERIGIIVVDEEHEASYKQGDGFRYNARDLALVRAKQLGASVLLGSATPQISTYHSAKSGRFGYLHLPCRVKGRPLPDTEILDIRGKMKTPLEQQLVKAISENLEAGGQTLLFLNRRGFATYLVCEACGYVYRCPNCAVTLTHHRRRKGHFCHYCDYSIQAPSICPACENCEITLLGRGTERLEEEIGILFPKARIIRMDRDTTTGKGGHARILKQVDEGTIDILIGTQMVAKGHDFPGVTLVGVVSADASLNLPDFRCAERTFQMITQVMGRAGRGDRAGKVLVQTFAPDHYAITHAITHDYEGFYRAELAFRQELDYPPFSRLAYIEISGANAEAVEKAAEAAAEKLLALKQQLKVRVVILGPTAAPLGMLRGRYRRQILLKAEHRTDLHRLLNEAKEVMNFPGAIKITIDVDPLDML